MGETTLGGTFCEKKKFSGANFSFISSGILRNTWNRFLTQSLQDNSCYLSNDNVFSTNFYHYYAMNQNPLT
jgi:hypothetical protein